MASRNHPIALTECCRSFELSPPTLTGRRLCQNVEIGFGLHMPAGFIFDGPFSSIELPRE